MRQKERGGIYPEEFILKDAPPMFNSGVAMLTYSPAFTIGKVVMLNGVAVGRGGTVVTTQRGKKALDRQGMAAVVADLERSLLYTAA